MNLDQLVDIIYEQVKGQENAPTKDQIKGILKNIQTILTDKNLTEEEKDKKMQVVVKMLYSGGSFTMQALGVADTTLTAANTAIIASGMTLTSGTMYALSGLTSTFNWAFAGIVMTAKTGIDYRKYKKG